MIILVIIAVSITKRRRKAMISNRRGNQESLSIKASTALLKTKGLYSWQ